MRLWITRKRHKFADSINDVFHAIKQASRLVKRRLIKRFDEKKTPRTKINKHNPSMRGKLSIEWISLKKNKQIKIDLRFFLQLYFALEQAFHS